jgi:hypothetical protein
MKKIYTRACLALLCTGAWNAGAQTTVTFNYTGSLQTFTVPSCVSSVTIEAYGAQGGNASYNNTPPGGLGAYIKGTFSVSPGQVLNILVGQKGQNGTGGCGDLNGGGGGGSFVWDPTNTTNPLIVAGGGGGSGSCGYSIGGPGQATLGGTGLGGNCGNCNNGNGTGGGGAGWNGNGMGCKSSSGCGAAPPALSPLNGGTGGSPWIMDCFQNGPGGYGGGGAGGGNCGGPGGGGGYTGGNAGGNVLVTNCSTDISNGGTSYNAGTNQTNTAGVQSNNGMVVITYSPGVPANAGPITGPLSVCAGSTVNYSISTVSGATSYSWSVPGGAVINSGQGTTSISVTFGSTSGTVSVTPNNSCGSGAAANLSVTVNSNPTVSLGADISQCGGTANLDAGNPGSTYLWSNNATTQTISVSTTGTYSVVVTNASGCTGTDAINVTINIPPTVALGADVSQCGGTVNLDAGNPGATYLWSDNSTTQTISVSASGTYSVVVTAANGCTGTDAINVTINTPPAVSLGQDVTQCGGSVMLDAQNAGSTYLWSDNSTAQTLSVSASGTYSVVVTDVNGCTGSDAINVTINSNPNVTLALNPSLVCITIPAYALTGGSPSGGTYSGTGVSGGNFDPAAAGLGTFTITYDYTDPNTGCQGQATQSITVDACTGIISSGILSQLSIYPNPASNLLTISAPADINSMFIELCDAQGKVVYSSLNDLKSGESIQLQVTGLADGIYSIRLFTDKDMAVKKLIIHH